MAEVLGLTFVRAFVSIFLLSENKEMAGGMGAGLQFSAEGSWVALLSEQ